MKKSVLMFFCVLVVCALLGIVLQSMVLMHLYRSSPQGSMITPEKQYAYAHTLMAKGLTEAAIEAFERYLTISSLSQEAFTEASYQVGQLYMEQGEYTKALACFYRIDAMGNAGSLQEEMNQKIVECLEHLGMSEQAQYETAQRTVLDATETKGKPVARIGTRTITEEDIAQAIDQMPPWMKEQLKDQQGRNQFIRNYVAQEVLYRKAQRLGFDRTPQVRETLAQMRKQLAVEQLVKKEVEEKVQIKDSDVELYYQARKDTFTEPRAVSLSYLTCADDTQEETCHQELKDGKGKKVEGWLTAEDTTIPGVGESAEAVTLLSTKEEGFISEPYMIQGTRYLFRVEAVRAPQEKSFEEVKDRAAYEYRMMKQKEVMQTVLSSALEEQEVQLFVSDAQPAESPAETAPSVAEETQNEDEKK